MDRNARVVFDHIQWSPSSQEVDPKDVDISVVVISSWNCVREDGDHCTG